MAGADIIFGMGMLEMGITFSFGQLIIDDLIVKSLKRTPKLIEEKSRTLDLPADLRAFVREYINGGPAPAPATTGDYDLSITPAQANTIADNIIATHKVPALPTPIKKEMRRIVNSAE